MKKLLFLFCFCASLLSFSCDNAEFAPIEKWGGGRYVITDKSSHNDQKDWLQLKNPDTIFWVKVLKFDSKKYNVGDTIK